MTAADILRKRAELADHNAMKASRYADEGYCVDAYKREAAEWHAVAELILRCRQPVWQVSRQGNEEMVGGIRFLGHRCLMCMSFGPEGAPIRHSHDCPLAALERLIEGERDGA